MWRAKPTSPTPAVEPITRQTFTRNSSEPFLSVGRPFTSARITSVPGRGYLFSLVDSSRQEVTTPVVTAEAIARALEGRPIVIRSGGFTVEFRAKEGCLHIKGGPLTGLQVEGHFRPDDIEAALRALSGYGTSGA